MIFGAELYVLLIKKLESSTGFCSHHLTDGTNAGVKKGMKTKCQLVNFLSYIYISIYCRLSNLFLSHLKSHSSQLIRSTINFISRNSDADFY